MILAIQYARTENIPYLGICLGSQLMAIEFARNVLNYSDATSEEFDPEYISKHHIVHIMEDQKNISEKGGTMRLGIYDCVLKEGSKVEELYKKGVIVHSEGSPLGGRNEAIHQTQDMDRHASLAMTTERIVIVMNSITSINQSLRKMDLLSRGLVLMDHWSRW